MPPLTYAIIGFGNVGAALARHASLRSTRISDRYGIDLTLRLVADSTHALADANGLDGATLANHRDRGGRIGDVDGAFAHRGAELLRDAALDCVVICLPTNRSTGEPGLSWARAAIDAGSNVVLADKGPALVALPELERAAAAKGLTVGASATVGSALPTLSVARRELAGAEILEIAAILNGTSNMVLSMMRSTGCGYDDAIAAAQRAGIAEPDPSYDVQGWDTAVKLTILARSLMDDGLSLASVDRRGIDVVPESILAEADRTGGRIRLVGRARRVARGVDMTVAPEISAPDDPFYLVEGPQKAVRFVTDDMGTLTVMGGASGRTDVAAALTKDILASRGRAF